MGKGAARTEAQRKSDLTRTQSAKRDADFFAERARERKVNDDKTARLRALRLEKEAADRLVAAASPPKPLAKARKKLA